MKAFDVVYDVGISSRLSERFVSSFETARTRACCASETIYVFSKIKNVAHFPGLFCDESCRLGRAQSLIKETPDHQETG